MLYIPLRVTPNYGEIHYNRWPAAGSDFVVADLTATGNFWYGDPAIQGVGWDPGYVPWSTGFAPSTGSGFHHNTGIEHRDFNVHVIGISMLLVILAHLND
jgi:hypothetical protein